MKVLFATPFRLDPEVGGPAHTVVSTGLELLQCGVETRFLTGDRRRYPPPGRATTLLDVRSVDVVHTFGIWVPFSHGVARVARLLDVPSVLAPIGMLEPWALKQSARKKQLAMRLYQRGDLDRASVVHATALAEADNLRALGIKRPIAFIPHGVALPDESETAQAVTPQDGVRTALFLSRIHPKKGLLELVGAWARLRPKGWRVRVVGPDENGHRAEVERAIAKHGLRDSFEFMGQVAPEQKHRVIRESELLVLPTYSENFGLVVPEALGHGIPVLTTKGAPWSELEQTDSGWWIDTGVDALTQALEPILRLDRAELRRMGCNGRRLVSERYSWSSVAARHVELYSWLLGNGPKPSFVFD
jgi:glycosyltransferase involved in cell wall biosynthesis